MSDPNDKSAPTGNAVDSAGDQPEISAVQLYRIECEFVTDVPRQTDHLGPSPPRVRTRPSIVSRNSASPPASPPSTSSAATSAALEQPSAVNTNTSLATPVPSSSINRNLGNLLPELENERRVAPQDEFGATSSNQQDSLPQPLNNFELRFSDDFKVVFNKDSLPMAIIFLLIVHRLLQAGATLDDIRGVHRGSLLVSTSNPSAVEAALNIPLQFTDELGWLNGVVFKLVPTKGTPKFSTDFATVVRISSIYPEVEVCLTLIHSISCPSATFAACPRRLDRQQ